MFGILKPSFKYLPAESKALYHASYCNLCAALSATGCGALNRFALINDVVTIDWLLTETKISKEHPFACQNCKKLGVIGKKSQVTEHQKFLAAVCSFTVGVKLKDNALDEPSFKTKVRALAYFPAMRKAKKSLKGFKLLDKFKYNLELEACYEAEKTSQLSKACLPTENCYELFTLEASKALSSLPKPTISLLGRYLGRYVYLYDALEDMDEDLASGRYNALNANVDYQGEPEKKELAAKRLLMALKGMHLELFERIASLPRELSADRLRMKWESLLLGIEERLFDLVRPMNSLDLSARLRAFAVISEGVRGLIKPMLDDSMNPFKGCPLCESPEGGGCDCCTGSGCDGPCKPPEKGGCNPLD